MIRGISGPFLLLPVFGALLFAVGLPLSLAVPILLGYIAGVVAALALCYETRPQDTEEPSATSPIWQARTRLYCTRCPPEYETTVAAALAKREYLCPDCEQDTQF